MLHSNIQAKNIMSLSSFALSLVLFLPATFSYAALPPQASTYEAADLESQRKQFLIAEKAIKLGRLQKYHQLKDTLKNYPLYPYLQMAEITRRISSVSELEVKDFLNTYSDTPLSDKLYHSWMRSLARHGKFKTLVANFRPAENVTQHCRFAHALMQTEQKDQAFALMDKLWLNGGSLPDTCNAPLKAWKEAGYLSNELLWGRIKLVMEKRNHRLATYLAKKITKR